MLDTFRNPQVSTTRHLFQFANRKFSLVFLLALAFANGWLLILHMPAKLIGSGLSVSVFVLFYLFLKHLLSARKIPFVLKEVFIAIGYSMGIMLVPFSNSQVWPMEWSILSGYLFLTALINVFIIGSFEKKDDLLLGEKSLIYFIHPVWLKRSCIVLSIAAMILAILLMKDQVVILALIILPLLLLLPLFFRESFVKQNLYRLWEDGMLMLPVPFLIFDSFL